MKRFMYLASVMSLAAGNGCMTEPADDTSVGTIEQNVSVGAVETDDFYGFAVVAGDFDGDNIQDLAVGAPGERPGSGKETGSVFIYKGTNSGLQLQEVINESDILTSGVHVDDGDRFGAALAIVPGAANGAPAQLIIGAPGGQTAGAQTNSGVVYVLHGGTNGPVASNAKILGQSFTAGTSGTSETGDAFGSSLDFANGLLAVGAPGENNKVGYVNTFKYDANSNTWTAYAGLPAPASHHGWGHAVAIADLDHDGRLDVAVGAYDTLDTNMWPFDNTFLDGGAIAVYPGQTGGYASPVVVNDPGPDASDMFGFSLTTGKFDNNANAAGGAELAIGSPGFNRTGTASAHGRVYVMGFSGTLAHSSWFMTPSDTSADFGYAIASGKLTSTSQASDDLVTGMFGTNQMVVLQGSRSDHMSLASKNTALPGLSSTGDVTTDAWMTAICVGRFTSSSPLAQVITGDWVQTVFDDGIPAQFSGSVTQWISAVSGVYPLSRYWDEGMAD